MRRGYIIGAGAQGRVVAENWRAQHPQIELSFFDDKAELWGARILGVEVVAEVSRLVEASWEEAGAIVGLGLNPLRLSLGERLREEGVVFAVVVHPSVTVMPSALIGEGSVVFAGSVINTEARVGRHVIVNTGSLVEHDCILEDGSSLGPGVKMAGRVTIGRGAFVSTGVTLAPCCRVGDGAVIGAGAVVVSDIPPRTLALGVPARVVREIGDDFEWGRLLYKEPRKP